MFCRWQNSVGVPLKYGTGPALKASRSSRCPFGAYLGHTPRRPDGARDSGRHHHLATSGPYARVRRPQYDGFLLIMIGFLLQWPAIPTLVMFPVLVVVYLRLAPQRGTRGGQGVRRRLDRLRRSHPCLLAPLPTARPAAPPPHGNSNPQFRHPPADSQEVSRHNSPGPRHTCSPSPSEPYTRRGHTNGEGPTVRSPDVLEAGTAKSPDGGWRVGPPGGARCWASG